LPSNLDPDLLILQWFGVLSPDSRPPEAGRRMASLPDQPHTLGYPKFFMASLFSNSCVRYW